MNTALISCNLTVIRSTDLNRAAVVENADEYSDIEELIDALKEQSWALVKSVCKASYRNGIKRGQRRQKSEA